MSKIFITGGNGFLGTHLRERLHGNLYLFSRDESMDGLIEFQPDYIFHCAGEIYEEKTMVESNILLTHRLLEASRSIPHLKAFIAIGSSSEYGRKDHPMTETDFLDPMTMYEATKGAASLLCQVYARSYGVPVMVARPFSLYGVHELDHRFIPTIIRSIRKHKKLLVAPGVHDFIHVDDFIDGLLLLSVQPHPGEIYNFGTEKQTSNEALVEIIEKLLNKTTEKSVIPPLHRYDSDHWVADTTKVRSLGWTPRYTLEEGLTQVLLHTPLETFV